MAVDLTKTASDLAPRGPRTFDLRGAMAPPTPGRSVAAPPPSALPAFVATVGREPTPSRVDPGAFRPSVSPAPGVGGGFRYSEPRASSVERRVVTPTGYQVPPQPYQQPPQQQQQLYQQQQPQPQYRQQLTAPRPPPQDQRYPQPQLHTPAHAVRPVAAHTPASQKQPQHQHQQQQPSHRAQHQNQGTPSRPQDQHAAASSQPPSTTTSSSRPSVVFVEHREGSAGGNDRPPARSPRKAQDRGQERAHVPERAHEEKAATPFHNAALAAHLSAAAGDNDRADDLERELHATKRQLLQATSALDACKADLARVEGRTERAVQEKRDAMVAAEELRLELAAASSTAATLRRDLDAARAEAEVATTRAIEAERKVAAAPPFDAPGLHDAAAVAGPAGTTSDLAATAGHPIVEGSLEAQLEAERAGRQREQQDFTVRFQQVADANRRWQRTALVVLQSHEVRLKLERAEAAAFVALVAQHGAARRAHEDGLSGGSVTPGSSPMSSGLAPRHRRRSVTLVDSVHSSASLGAIGDDGRPPRAVSPPHEATLALAAERQKVEELREEAARHERAARQLAVEKREAEAHAEERLQEHITAMTRQHRSELWAKQGQLEELETHLTEAGQNIKGLQQRIEQQAGAHELALRAAADNADIKAAERVRAAQAAGRIEQDAARDQLQEEILAAQQQQRMHKAHLDADRVALEQRLEAKWSDGAMEGEGWLPPAKARDSARKVEELEQDVARLKEEASVLEEARAASSGVSERLMAQLESSDEALSEAHVAASRLLDENRALKNRATTAEGKVSQLETAVAELSTRYADGGSLSGSGSPPRRKGQDVESEQQVMVAELKAVLGQTAAQLQEKQRANVELETTVDTMRSELQQLLEQGVLAKEQTIAEVSNLRQKAIAAERRAAMAEQQRDRAVADATAERPLPALPHGAGASAEQAGTSSPPSAKGTFVMPAFPGFAGPTGASPLVHGHGHGATAGHPVYAGDHGGLGEESFMMHSAQSSPGVSVQRARAVAEADPHLEPPMLLREGHSGVGGASASLSPGRERDGGLALKPQLSIPTRSKARPLQPRPSERLTLHGSTLAPAMDKPMTATKRALPHTGRYPTGPSPKKPSPKKPSPKRKAAVKGSRLDLLPTGPMPAAPTAAAAEAPPPALLATLPGPSMVTKDDTEASVSTAAPPAPLPVPLPTGDLAALLDTQRFEMIASPGPKLPLARQLDREVRPSVSLSPLSPSVARGGGHPHGPADARTAEPNGGLTDGRGAALAVSPPDDEAAYGYGVL